MSELTPQAPPPPQPPHTDSPQICKGNPSTFRVPAWPELLLVPSQSPLNLKHLWFWAESEQTNGTATVRARTHWHHPGFRLVFALINHACLSCFSGWKDSNLWIQTPLRSWDLHERAEQPIVCVGPQTCSFTCTKLAKPHESSPETAAAVAAGWGPSTFFSNNFWARAARVTTFSS